MVDDNALSRGFAVAAATSNINAQNTNIVLEANGSPRFHWRDRTAFVSGPAEMLDAMEEYWEAEGDPDLLNMEHFQPKIGGGEEGEGGKIVFTESREETECDGGTPILVAGEEAGLKLPFGCREGICHTCVGTLREGKVRDLRTGKVHGNQGETIRTCIHAPEGPIEIEL